MKHSIPLLLYIVTILMTTGCDNSTALIQCPGIPEWAITVELADAITGQYIAKDAKGVIIDGEFTDSLRHADITQVEPELIVRALAGGSERPGTYDVQIELEGYKSWSRDNIEVPAGDCGPETQSFNVRLRRDTN